MVDVEQIRERVTAASPGQWQRHGCDVWREGDKSPLLRGRDDNAHTRQQSDADAEFVAHARQDILDLLDLLRQPAAAVTDGPEPLTTAPGPFTS